MHFLYLWGHKFIYLVWVFQSCKESLIIRCRSGSSYKHPLRITYITSTVSLPHIFQNWWIKDLFENVSFPVYSTHLHGSSIQIPFHFCASGIGKPCFLFSIIYFYSHLIVPNQRDITNSFFKDDLQRSKNFTDNLAANNARYVLLHNINYCGLIVQICNLTDQIFLQDYSKKKRKVKALDGPHYIDMLSCTKLFRYEFLW